MSPGRGGTVARGSVSRVWLEFTIMLRCSRDHIQPDFFYSRPYRANKSPGHPPPRRCSLFDGA